jgi:hypothetical protein
MDRTNYAMCEHGGAGPGRLNEVVRSGCLSEASRLHLKICDGCLSGMPADAIDALAGHFRV